jgi:hypothetical protein
MATAWASIKLIFLPNGSNGIKCLYLKPDNVVVVANSDIMDIPMMKTALSSRVFSIWFPVPGMTHWGKKGFKNPLNISIAMNALRIGVETSRIGRFPSDLLK